MNSTGQRLGLAVCCWAALAFTAQARADVVPLTPNDPYYQPFEWYGSTLNLPTAWGYGTGSSNVIVAVIDTGVVSTTSELSGRLLPAVSVTGVAPFSDATLMANSSLHHGTWVASTIAMTVNNGYGGAGIGNFSILPITDTNSSGSNTSDWLVAAIHLAADDGARVINISQSALFYGPLDDAAAYARSKGALVFVAAGNTNTTAAARANTNLIYVGGTDQSDQRWVQNASVGSTAGSFVDLSAPAAGILVQDAATPDVFGTVDGTSFSSALAAGAAALAWSENPNLTPDQVESLLYSTAKDLDAPGRDDVFGNGRIDVGALVAAAVAVPEPSSIALILSAALALACVRYTRRAFPQLVVKR